MGASPWLSGLAVPDRLRGDKLLPLVQSDRAYDILPLTSALGVGRTPAGGHRLLDLNNNTVQGVRRVGVDSLLRDTFPVGSFPL